MAKEQDLIIKIKADTDKAVKEVSTLTKDIKKLNTETKKTGSNEADVNKLSKGFSGVTKAITGVVAGLSTLAIGMKAVEFAKMAGEAEQAGEAFDVIFTDLGLNAVEQFEKIREASKGLIDDASIKQSAVTAVSLGVPIEKLAELMEIARVKARIMGTDVKSAFNDLAVGIGRGSPMILDNLGLIIKLEEANKEYAQELGKTVAELSKQEKQIALTNAVIKASEADMRRFGDAEKNTKERTQELGASINNLKVKIGEQLLPTMEKLTLETKKFVDGLDEADWEKFGSGVEKTVGFLGDLLSILGVLNDIAYPDLFGAFGDKTFTGETANVLGDISTQVGVWSDVIDGLINAQDELFASQAGYDNLKTKVDNFTGSQEDFEKLERSMKATIDETSKLHKKWSESDSVTAYQDELGGIEEVLKGLGDEYAELQLKKPFETTITSADLAKDSVEDLSDAVKDYTEDEIKAIEKANKTVLSSVKTKSREHLSTVKKLTADIAKAHQKLADDLKKISDERWATELSLNDRIRDINQSGLTDVQSYKDKELERDEKLASAREALADNELQKFKTYIQQYEALGLELAQKQITTEGVVQSAKADTHNKSLEILNTEKALYTEYYDQQAKNAQTAHDKTVTQKEAELNGTLALIEANKVLMDLLVQLIEGLTGKKITLDTSEIDGLVSKIKGAQTYIGFLTNEEKKVKLDSQEIDVATQKIQEIKTLTLNGVTLEIKSDTTPASFGISKLITEEKNNEIILTVNPDWTNAEKELENERKQEEKKPIEQEIELNTKQSNAEIEQWKKDLEAIPLVKSVTVAVDEDGDFDEFVAKTAKPSEHTIDVDNTETRQAVAENKVDTWSTHTIYVKEVHQRSEGGSIPQRLASGGTFSGSGRVGGYDPTDSDKVNAFLTGGEFVIKRSAVDLYGLSFLNALNSMKLPKIKGYATGGLVGSQSETAVASQLRPIQLNVGGSSFELLSETAVADALQRYINNEGGL